MAYGTIKVDQITFTNSGVDQTITVSGIVESISGNITATGTIQAQTIIGTSTVSGATVTGVAGQFTTATITSGVFASGTAAAPSVSVGTTSNGIYSPATNQVALSTSGTGRLYIDANGLVGIGTSTPSSYSFLANALVIEGTNHEGISIISGADRSGNIWFGDPDLNGVGQITYSHLVDAMLFATNGIGRLRITGTGDLIHIGGGDQFFPAVSFNGSAPSNSLIVGPTGLVGIGATPVARALEVNTTLQVGAVIRSTSTVSSRLSLQDANTSGDSFVGIGSVGNNCALFAGAAERLRITNAGLVGIGTTSPQRQLSLYDATTSAIALQNATTGTGQFQGFQLQAAGTAGYVYNYADGPIVFGSNAVERARITNTGFVGIGTSAPSTKLHVKSADTSGGIIGTFDDSGATSVGRLQIRTSGGAGTDAIRLEAVNRNLLQLGAANNPQLTINAVSGNVGIGTTTPLEPLHVENLSADLMLRSTSDTGNSRIFFGDLSATNAGLISYAHTDNSLSFNVNGGEKARIDSSGRLLVGTSSALNVGITAGFSGFQIAATTSASTIQQSRFSNDASGTFFVTSKSRGALGVNTVVNNGDALGSWSFTGADGTNYIEAARIRAEVDGTPGANDMPGRLVFSTTADGESSPTERLRITSAGNVGIGTVSPTESLEVVGNAILDANNATLKIKQGVTGTTGAIDFTFNTDSTSYGSLNLAYDDRLTQGLRLNTIYPLTLECGNSEEILFKRATTESARIDSSGRLLVGTSSNLGTIASDSYALQVAGINDPTCSSGLFRFQGNSAASILSFTKSRGTSVGTNTAVLIDDNLGILQFRGADGTGYIQGASIAAQVDGTPNTNDMPGRLVFSTTADGDSSPTERLRITSAGNVGIGTNAPLNTLHVVGTSDTTNNGATVLVDSNAALAADIGGSIAFRATDGGATVRTYGLVRGGKETSASGSFNGYLAFETRLNGQANTTERLRINSLGAVGIGTTAPSTLLQVGDGTQTGNHYARIFGSQSDLYLGQSGSALFGSGAGNYIVSTNSQPISIGSTASQPIIFGTSNLERARISGGNLLVGASNDYSPPSQNLIAQFNVVNNAVGGIAVNNWSVSGSAPGGRISLTRSIGTTPGTFTLSTLSAQYGQIDFWGADGTKFVEAARIVATPDGTPGLDDMPGRLVFSTTPSGSASPVERMRIGNTGVVYIGQTATTLPGGGNTVAGHALRADGIALHSVDNNYALLLNRSTSDGVLMQARREGLQVGSISVTTTATAYNTSSDYRLKENVTPVTDGITRLQQLKPSRFNFIADPDKTVDGFLAHEVQTIVPEAITGEKDAVDEDGNPQYQGIDQSKLVPLLTAALQEAVAEINALKDRLTAAGL